MESNFQPGDILIRKPGWKIHYCSLFECIDCDPKVTVRVRCLDGNRKDDIVTFIADLMLRDDFRTAVHKRRLACSK